uniref:Rapunzel n=1 Tax=Oryzias sinensis TaxID=183150 RepID=A0A8C7Y8C3_9TELE
MEVDKAKLQEAAIVGLNVLKAVASAASVFFPPIGIAGSLIGVVLKFVDKNDGIENLKKEFQLIHQGLDELSKQNQQTMKTIIKETADQQFSRVERSLKWQYEKYMKMISAPPEHVQRRSEEFVEAYDDELGDQHLNTLYESVIGVPKVFGKPILQVYKQHSRNDLDTMTKLSHQLFYLFSIGCITLMANAVLIGDDVESLREEWEDKMNRVWSEMEKALKDCQ